MMKTKFEEGNKLMPFFALNIDSWLVILFAFTIPVMQCSQYWSDMWRFGLSFDYSKITPFSGSLLSWDKGVCMDSIQTYSSEDMYFSHLDTVLAKIAHWDEQIDSSSLEQLSRKVALFTRDSSLQYLDDSILVRVSCELFSSNHHDFNLPYESFEVSTDTSRSLNFTYSGGIHNIDKNLDVAGKISEARIIRAEQVSIYMFCSGNYCFGRQYIVSFFLSESVAMQYYEIYMASQ